jgi:hypothetical protein
MKNKYGKLQPNEPNKLYHLNKAYQMKEVDIHDQVEPVTGLTVAELVRENELIKQELQSQTAMIRKFIAEAGIVMPKLPLQEQLRLIHTIRPNEEYAVLHLNKDLIIQKVVPLPRGVKIVSLKDVPEKATYGYYKLIKGQIVADENLAKHRFGTN